MLDERFFRIALLVLLVSFILHRGYTTRKNSPSIEQIEKKRDESGLIPRLSGLLGLVALLSSAIYIFNPQWITWASFSLPAWLRWLGMPMALFGFYLVEVAQRALGSNWSDTPVLTKDQTLSTSGPYRRIRHPIYTAFLFILSAPMLLSANWLLGLSWILMTSLDVRSRASYEEGILLERFGSSYKNYMKGTGRFFPRIGV